VPMLMQSTARRTACAFRCLADKCPSRVRAGADYRRSKAEGAMAKIRFPRKLEVYVPEAMADALELLAGDQLLTVSDHMRQALLLYLQHRGVPMRSAPNGGHGAHQATDHGRL
jgi:hypothetical protein